MLAVRLSAETERRLDELAARTGRTKTFYAREAIEAHLDDLEEFYLAEERLRGFRAAGAPVSEDKDRDDVLASLRRLWAQGEASGEAVEGNFDAKDVARRGAERLAAGRREG